MIVSPEVFTAEIEQKEYSCIAIGPKGMDLPSYLMHGGKQCGYLIRDGEAPMPWYWQGFSIVEERRCFYFEKLNLFPITEIATTRRGKALSLVRDLSQALSTLPSRFLDLSSNTLPIWRIWAIEEGGFLILPQDLADLFSSCAEEEERYLMSSAWVHHGIHTPFALCDQMVQLLYFAYAGFPPFAQKATREDGFRALPLSLLATSVSEKTVTFIDGSLRMSLAKQREASGNAESQKALSWFFSATASLHWDAENRLQAPSYEDMRDNPTTSPFLQSQEKRANRVVFWRKKGWIVITVLLSSILVISFTTGRIKDALAPPYTAGLNQQQVIEEYFVGQNELDLQKMEASLGKKVKNPAAMEVTNLFVSRQTRQAYEGITTQVDPNKWIANGKPALLEGTFLYGVTDVSVKALDSTSYEVSSTLYSPYPYFEDQEGTMVEAGEVVIFRYNQVQVFTVELAKRGWFEITSITNRSVSKLDLLRVPTYQKGTMLPGTN